MNKRSGGAQGSVFCGIDVSAQSLAVAVIEGDQPVRQREFCNRQSGHRELIVWLGKNKSKVRVSLEATGIYSLDLALALDAAPHIELAVLNPKLVNRFAQTLVRSQSDASAALVLAEYSRRMPFAAWSAPSSQGLELRSVARHIDALVAQQTRELNRLHAVDSSRTAPRAVVADIKQGLACVARRIGKMRRAARKMIAADAELEQRFQLLTAMPGIGPISAIQLLGETVLLSPELTARQWVAHSGLDPVHHDSGTSVHKKPHISRAGNRHLRRALFMPALAAARCDPHLKAFYQALQARHKTKLQALVAVARKLLHAIYGILKTRTSYDGNKLFPQLLIGPELQSASG
jgi:transposase